MAPRHPRRAPQPPNRNRGRLNSVSDNDVFSVPTNKAPAAASGVAPQSVKPLRAARSSTPVRGRVSNVPDSTLWETNGKGPASVPEAEARHPRTTYWSKLASYPARARSARMTPQEVADAIQLARDGNDALLLPYKPTPSINPPRPRTLAAGYDKNTQTLRVRFRDGTPWEYYNVPPRVWRNFQRVKSPGRFINRTLNHYPYSRGDF